MSITRALIFERVSINDVDYSPHLADSVEITVEPVVQEVLNNQTLPSAWDVSFSVDMLNSAIQDDANIYSNSANNVLLANIRFEGVAGASNLTMNNCVILATPNFEGERTAYTLSGSKRMTSVPTVVTVEDVD